MTNSRYAPLNLNNTYHDSNIDGNNNVINNNSNDNFHINNDGNTTRSSVRRQSFEKPHKTLRGASRREHLEGIAYDFRSTSSLASNDSKYNYNTCANNNNENINTSNNNIRRGNSYEHGPNRKASMSSMSSELSSTRFDNNCNNNNNNHNNSKSGNEAHNNENDEINSQLKSSVAQAAIRVRESLEAKLSE